MAGRFDGVWKWGMEDTHWWCHPPSHPTQERRPSTVRARPNDRPIWSSDRKFIRSAAARRALGNRAGNFAEIITIRKKKMYTILSGIERKWSFQRANIPFFFFFFQPRRVLRECGIYNDKLETLGLRRARRSDRQDNGAPKVLLSESWYYLQQFQLRRRNPILRRRPFDFAKSVRRSQRNNEVKKKIRFFFRQKSVRHCYNDFL